MNKKILVLFTLTLSIITGTIHPLPPVNKKTGLALTSAAALAASVGVFLSDKEVRSALKNGTFWKLIRQRGLSKKNARPLAALGLLLASTGAGIGAWKSASSGATGAGIGAPATARQKALMAVEDAHTTPPSEAQPLTPIPAKLSEQIFTGLRLVKPKAVEISVSKEEAQKIVESLNLASKDLSNPEDKKEIERKLIFYWDEYIDARYKTEDWKYDGYDADKPKKYYDAIIVLYRMQDYRIPYNTIKDSPVVKNIMESDNTALQDFIRATSEYEGMQIQAKLSELKGNLNSIQRDLKGQLEGLESLNSRKLLSGEEEEDRKSYIETIAELRDTFKKTSAEYAAIKKIVDQLDQLNADKETAAAMALLSSDATQNQAAREIQQWWKKEKDKKGSFTPSQPTFDISFAARIAQLSYEDSRALIQYVGAQKVKPYYGSSSQYPGPIPTNLKVRHPAAYKIAATYREIHATHLRLVRARERNRNEASPAKSSRASLNALIKKAAKAKQKITSQITQKFVAFLTDKIKEFYNLPADKQTPKTLSTVLDITPDDSEYILINSQDSQQLVCREVIRGFLDSLYEDFQKERVNNLRLFDALPETEKTRAKLAEMLALSPYEKTLLLKDLGFADEIVKRATIGNLQEWLSNAGFIDLYAMSPYTTHRGGASATDTYGDDGDDWQA